MEVQNLTNQIQAIFLKANKEALELLTSIQSNISKEQETINAPKIDVKSSTLDNKGVSDKPKVEEFTYANALMLSTEQTSENNVEKKMESTKEIKKSGSTDEKKIQFKAGDIPLCLFGLKCTNQNCTWYHGTRDCKHGSNCNKPFCRFKHGTIRGLSPAHKSANYEPKRTCIKVSDTE